MNEIITKSSLIPLPAPKVSVSIRLGTMADVDFVDKMQKKTVAQVGFMPTAQIEGKIKLGHVLIAENGNDRLGYCIGNDQYFKHDDLGIIYALNVVPGSQRKLVGATLIKAMFERAAYGCRLFCCWCAQDIDANYFWESIGFVPIAFRAGSRGKVRVHIFWQKRIREGDTTTPYWFPCQTSGGSMREDRIVLPIPPGTHWKDAKPIILPGAEGSTDTPLLESNETKAPPRKRKPKSAAAPVVITKSLPANVAAGIRFGPPPVEIAPVEKPKREPKPKVKNDPRYVAAARELRDRWTEEQQSGRLVIESNGKYDVARMIELTGSTIRPQLPSAMAA